MTILKCGGALVPYISSTPSYSPPDLVPGPSVALCISIGAIERNYLRSMVRVSRLIALMAISLMCGCTDIGEEVVDYHNKILFSSRRSGKDQLYMMSPDGSEIRQLTFGPYFNRDGRWSPDASQIVCNAEEYSTTAGLMMKVFNSDGSDVRYLVKGHQMVWDPTGRIIFFTYCPSCELGILQFGLYSIGRDGSNRTLTPYLDFAAEPSFSPDGRTAVIAFPDSASSSSVIKLLDYPGFVNARTIGPISVTAPEWSRDGREIVFSSDSNGTVNGPRRSNIFVMTSAGTNVRRITDNQTRDNFLQPTWSRDDKQIAYLSQTIDGTNESYLWIVNRDGSGIRRLIDDPTVFSVDWSK